MAALLPEINGVVSHVQLNRQAEHSAELERVLERCIKGSRAVDTETLCVLAHKKESTHFLSCRNHKPAIQKAVEKHKTIHTPSR